LLGLLVPPFAVVLLFFLISEMSGLLQAVGLMKKPLDPVEQTKEWQKKIRREIRQTEREIQGMAREVS